MSRYQGNVGIFREELEKMNARFYLIKSEYVEQYAEQTFKAYVGGWSLAKLSGALRQMGDRLNGEQRARYGITARCVVGYEFAESVTPLALSDPVEASRAIANAGPARVRWQDHFAHSIQDHTLVRLLIRDDAKTCNAARSYIAGVMEPRNLPEFPLHHCDKWTCRCAINRYAEWMGGRKLD